MAIIEQFFFGWETGGRQEVSLASGSVVTSPAPWSSKESYVEKMLWKSQVHAPFNFVPNSQWVTIGFNIQFSDVNPDADNNFLRINDGAFSDHLSLQLQGGQSGFIRIIDANGNVAATSGKTVVSINIWYRITIKFRLTSSTSIRVWIQKSSDPIGFPLFDLVVDALSGSFPGTIRVMWHNQKLFGAMSKAFYLGNAYVRTDDGSTINSNKTILGPFVILGPFNDTNSGISPDVGDNLVKGSTWSNTSGVPVSDSTLAQYLITSLPKEGMVSANDGTNTGPNGQTTDFDGNLIAHSGIWRVKESQSTAPTSFTGKLGQFADPFSDATAFGPELSLTSSFQNYQVFQSVDNSAKNMWAQIGFKVINELVTSTISVSGMWSFYLHEEPLPARRINFDGLISTIT